MSRPVRHALVVPELGIHDQPLVLSLWLVERGSVVVAGDRLVEVLAGGVTVDLSAPASGTLSERLVHEDQSVRPGMVLGVIEESAAEEGGSV